MNCSKRSINYDSGFVAHLSLTGKMACRSPVSHLSLTCHHHGSVNVVVLPFETILTKRKPHRFAIRGVLFIKLAYTLCEHSIYNFFKSCNVSSGNIVTFHSVTFCSIVHVVADVYHDVLQLCIYFFKCPAKSLAVL